MYVTMPWMTLNYKDIEMLRQLGTVIYIRQQYHWGPEMYSKCLYYYKRIQQQETCEAQFYVLHTVSHNLNIVNYWVYIAG